MDTKNREYEAPMACIVTFEAEDILTASPASWNGTDVVDGDLWQS